MPRRIADMANINGLDKRGLPKTLKIEYRRVGNEHINRLTSYEAAQTAS
jgi:hypothetical protein